MEGVPISSGSVNMSNSLKKCSINGWSIAVFYAFLFVILVTADQFLKQAIVNNIELGGQKDIIEGFFSFYYTRNTGSAFSLFADQDWGIYFLSAISTILGIGIFALMIISSSHEMKLISLAFCLLSSGAIGNLIDRFRLRYVVDFLRLDFGSYTFPIFNFADICAVLGTILLICIIIFNSEYFEKFWSLLFARKTDKTKEASAEDSDKESVDAEEEKSGEDESDDDKSDDEIKNPEDLDIFVVEHKDNEGDENAD